jgi:hypothetical protein
LAHQTPILQSLGGALQSLRGFGSGQVFVAGIRDSERGKWLRFDLGATGLHLSNLAQEKLGERPDENKESGADEALSLFDPPSDSVLDEADYRKVTTAYLVFVHAVVRSLLAIN